jgi:hypothetical protein
LIDGASNERRLFCRRKQQHFQNLLETSVNDAERLTIQKLLAEEKLKGSLQASKLSRASIGRS